eukprot:1183483-Prorocentrum_minimum.AAC.9
MRNSGAVVPRPRRRQHVSQFTCSKLGRNCRGPWCAMMRGELHKRHTASHPPAPMVHTRAG